MTFTGDGQTLASYMADLSIDMSLTRQLVRDLVPELSDLLVALDGRSPDDVSGSIISWLLFTDNFSWTEAGHYAEGVNAFVAKHYHQDVEAFEYACATCGGRRYRSSVKGTFWEYRFSRNFEPHTVVTGNTESVREKVSGVFTCTHCSMVRDDLVRLPLKARARTLTSSN